MEAHFPLSPGVTNTIKSMTAILGVGSEKKNTEVHSERGFPVFFSSRALSLVKATTCGVS